MSQSERLYDLLSDGKPHNTVEILEFVYGGSHLGLARVGARVNDLVNQGSEFLDKDGNLIEGENKRRGWHDDKNPAIYWYWMKPETVFPDAYKVQGSLEMSA